MTHICVSRLTIIGSDNGLSPGRHQAIIWTNAEILSMRTLGANFSEILIEIHIFSFKKTHFSMSSGNWRPFCLDLNMLSCCMYSETNQLGGANDTFYDIAFINTLGPRQNGNYFADDIFKFIFFNENDFTLNQISLIFFPESPVNNKPVLVHIQTRCRSGDKPSSESMLV